MNTKLLFVILAGFIIPWIITIPFFQRDKKVFILIAPVSSIFAFVINIVGYQMGFFYLLPLYEIKLVTAMFTNLGLFALMPCYEIFIIRHTTIKPIYSVFGFAFLNTLFEYLGLATGFVEYYNGWNIFYTFFSYFIPFYIIYFYYLWTKRLGII